jgi:serine phosphatase RsbU (regulator of sigma subunit)
MALFRSLLRISLQQAQPGQAAAQRLERAVAFTNDYVATVHARDNMFATVFAAIVDPATGQTDYINAGHDAPLLLRRGAVEAERLPPQGLALGMMAGQAHRACRTRLSAGDRLLVFSDGLPEALSPQNQDFGGERVSAAITQPADSPQALLSSLQDALARHVGNRDPHDDVTLLCLFPTASG